MDKNHKSLLKKISDYSVDENMLALWKSRYILCANELAEDNNEKTTKKRV